ncbi:hypothetical protein, partial [Pseudomonas syringae]|uniref:hypothetical protein n=1 Tax=Pseudomonas syringae TaxID=317 RepID=UPI0006466FCE
LELLISGRRILQRYNRVSNSFFSPLSINPDPTFFLATLHSKTLQTIDLQGFFVSVCAGSGANYRHLTEDLANY